MCCFSLVAFNEDFLFISVFQSFEPDVPGCDFLCIYNVSFLGGILASVTLFFTMFWKTSSIISSFIFAPFFFFPLHFGCSSIHVSL